MTRIVMPTDDSMALAMEQLGLGHVIGLPTETVYGLAADATHPQGIARIYEIKNRPRFNPLIIHCADFDMAAQYGDISKRAARLANALWPGPLSIIVPTGTSKVADLALAGLESIALRVPAHPIARELIARFGRPLAAPSANLSGKISPTSARHVGDDLEGRIELVLDGDSCDKGLESTIVSFLGDKPVLVRLGSVSCDEIEGIIGPLDRALQSDKPVSPGQLLRHYAPNAKLRLNAYEACAGEAYLGFGKEVYPASLNLSPSGDLAEAAANLFAHLRQLDREFTHIAIAPIPNSGLGEAINDRLQRAIK